MKSKELAREIDSSSIIWSLVSLHFFQFKLLYKILATNRMLYECGIQSSQLCRFCCEEAVISSFVLILSKNSLFLVAGSGMAEELQYLPGANPADSTTGLSEKS